MNSQQQEHLKAKLEQEQHELHQQLERMEEHGLGVPLNDSISELSSYDNHPADIGSEVFERSKDFALREGLEIHLEQIQDALARMSKGEYGLCAQCGQEIPLERLEALPTASKCVQCKHADELPDRHLRPIEEDVIVPPFGGRTHDASAKELGDHEDENMFDGEDAWQLLTHYGEHAQEADAGAYYGGMDYDEDIGFVEDVDHIVYERGADGMIYGRMPANEVPDHRVFTEGFEDPDEPLYPSELD